MELHQTNPAILSQSVTLNSLKGITNVQKIQPHIGHKRVFFGIFGTLACTHDDSAASKRKNMNVFYQFADYLHVVVSQ